MRYALLLPPRQARMSEVGMSIQRRHLLFFLTLVAAVAPTASGAESGASIPDVSGVWLHPSIPGFEPLSSGPTSVVNKSRLRTGPQAGSGNINQLVGDYTNPILKPEAAEVLKQHGEIMLSGNGYPDPRNQCQPQGVPYVFTSGGMQLLHSATRKNVRHPL